MQFADYAKDDGGARFPSAHLRCASALRRSSVSAGGARARAEIDRSTSPGLRRAAYGGDLGRAPRRGGRAARERRHVDAAGDARRPRRSCPADFASFYMIFADFWV